ncbi:MAG: hypothetical protein K6D96_05390 [Acetatifactor sp.]|nr:hypothetical protein [Acetatifactor sp.]
MDMNDVKMMKIAEWSRLIKAANESHLSREKWCETNNVSESSFYYWQRKVRKYALDTIPGSDDAKPVNQAPDFYEITIPVENTAPIDVPSKSPAEKYPDVIADPGVITIRSGRFEIDIRESFSRQALKSVLEVIKHV